MQTQQSVSKKRVWTGRILTALAVLFMLFDSITKLLRVDAVVKASAQLGFTPEDISVIGSILLICVIVYVIPRTSILGAILLTGYFGGAVATNLRMGTPLFSNILFPVYFGIIVWAGLFLREQRVSRIFFLRKAH
jgi:hypothetical protein